MEWESIATMLTEESLSRVKQLGFESHIREVKRRNPMSLIGSKDFYNYWKLMESLKSLGFLKWYSHMNRHCVRKSLISGEIVSHCQEMVYINTKFLTG